MRQRTRTVWLAIGCCALFAAVSCGHEPSSEPSPSTSPEVAGAASPAASRPSAAGGGGSEPTEAGTPVAAASGNRGGTGDASGGPPPEAAPATSPPLALPPPTNPARELVPTLFYLNMLGGVWRAAPDGSDRHAIVSGMNAGTGPDGVAVDVAHGHVYWTTMGAVSSNDGTIMRSDLDGKHVTTIVPAGGTFTPKQLKIDPQNGKLYWSDREGMRVMRANLDGSNIEALVVTGSGTTQRRAESRWCVGIAIDVPAGKLYWTQKGGDNAREGTIKRANLELPGGQAPAERTDIEVLFQGLPEPIDLDLDLDARQLYWTDRGDNTISRAPLDPPAGFDPSNRTDRVILVRNLGEVIGIALDRTQNRMFYSTLGGLVGTAALDGKRAHNLLTGQGSLTGIALAELPK